MRTIKGDWWRVWAACALPVLVASCGNDGDTSAPIGDSLTGPSTAEVVRLEVSPTTVLLTAAGQARKLSVRAFDANGLEVANPALVFSSSRPSEVGVAADGTLSAASAVGSALIQVSSGSVSAAPLLATVAEPAPGTVLVADEQVVAGPAPVDPAAAPGVGFRYQVGLNKAGPLAPGTLVMGTGAQPVAGRVVSATTAGDRTDVVLEIVSMPELFKELSVDISYSPEQTAQFLRPVAPIAGSQGAGSARAMSVLDKVKCKGDAGFATLTGEFKLKIVPSVKTAVIAKVSGFTPKVLVIAVDGTMDATGTALVNLGAAVSGEVGCKINVANIPIPITGALSFFIAPVVPLNAVLKLTGQVGANLFTFGAQVKERAELAVGISYTEEGGLVPINKLTFHEPEMKHDVNFPTDASVRVRTSVFAGLASGLGIGNVLLNFEMLSLSAGPEIEMKFGGPYDVSQDALYDAAYVLKGKMSIGPGSDLQEAIKLLLGSKKALDPSTAVEKKLARTAEAAEIKVDRNNFSAGELLTFNVKLKPENVSFPLIGYNVKEVQLYRLEHGAATATRIASAVATPGQTDFRLTWVADVTGKAVDDVNGKAAFYAFFADQPLSPVSEVFPFELGPVTATVKGVTCAPDKRFCAVAHDVNIANSDVDIFVNEAGIVYVADWRFGALAVYPPGGQKGVGGSSRNPPRAGMPSRSGKFVVKDDATSEWYVVDASNPVNLTYVRLPAKNATGETVAWQAVADSGWVIGNVSRSGGQSAAMRVDGSTVVVDPVKGPSIVAVVEELLIVGGGHAFATDVNDSGRIVGIIGSPTPTKIFVWSGGAASYVDFPDATGCFHATINRDGTIVAACSTTAGTYAFIRPASSPAWTKVTASVAGPEPAAFYPIRANSKGQVVTSTSRRGVFDDIVVWEAGTAFSILANTGFDLGAPTQLWNRAGINDKGQIGIWAATDPAGPKRVYLVSPNAAYLP